MFTWLSLLIPLFKPSATLVVKIARHSNKIAPSNHGVASMLKTEEKIVNLLIFVLVFGPTQQIFYYSLELSVEM